MRVVTLLGLLLAGTLALAQASMPGEQHHKVLSAAEIKASQLPIFPACFRIAAVRGDPAKEPSVIYGEGTAGCTIPYHWHTPVEEVMMVSGRARLEVKGGSPQAVSPGGYVYLPSKNVHQFTCATKCSLYVLSSSAFDIHYVDVAGNEIPPEKALKSPGKPAAAGAKKK